MYSKTREESRSRSRSEDMEWNGGCLELKGSTSQKERLHGGSGKVKKGNIVVLPHVQHGRWSGPKFCCNAGGRFREIGERGCRGSCRGAVCSE